MNKSLKIILPIALISSSVFILSQLKKDSNNISTKNESSVKTNNVSSTDKNISTINHQKLTVILNKCSGCGRCVRIDPSHFEIINNVAHIISFNNLTSSNLSIAINNCPNQAIKLE